MESDVIEGQVQQDPVSPDGGIPFVIGWATVVPVSVGGEVKQVPLISVLDSIAGELSNLAALVFDQRQKILSQQAEIDTLRHQRAPQPAPAVGSDKETGFYL